MADVTPAAPGAPTPAPAPAPAPAQSAEVQTTLGKAIALAFVFFAMGLGADFGYHAYRDWRGPIRPPPPPIQLPAEVSGHFGRAIVIAGKTPADKIVFYAAKNGPTNPDLIAKDTKSVTFVTPVPGDYVVYGWAVIKDAPYDSACIVHVTGDGPAPPGPTPPPGPPPPGPAPNDPFMATLQAAWSSETDANKSANLPKLSAAYRQAAGDAADGSIASMAALYVKFREHIDDLPEGCLPKIRDAVGAELKAKLPTSSNAPLDAAARKLCADTFNRIAGDLEAIK